MKIKTPLVSIIIPTYNRAELIVETLQSVQAQTYPNWECIVVDDGSDDNTKEIIGGFSTTDRRFKYEINNRSKGAPGSRNTGLYLSKGELIIFFDSDDKLLPKYIENKIKYFLADPKLDLVISLSRRLEDGMETFYVNKATNVEPLVRFYSLYPIADIPWINSTLIKKYFLIRNNVAWDESVKLHQDIQFNVCLLTRNPVFIWAKEELDNYWVYNKNSNSIGNMKYNEIEIVKKLIEIYWNNLQNATIDSNLKKQVNKQYHAQLIGFCDKLSHSLSNNNDFLQFVESKSLFSATDIWLLKKKMRFIKKLPVGLIERIYWKTIRMYFQFFYSPVISSGNYLKHTEV